MVVVFVGGLWGCWGDRRVELGVSRGGRGSDFRMRLSVDGVLRCGERTGDGGTGFVGGAGVGCGT